MQGRESVVFARICIVAMGGWPNLSVKAQRMWRVNFLIKEGGSHGTAGGGSAAFFGVGSSSSKWILTSS